MPGNERGASCEPAPYKINPDEKISLDADLSAARTRRVLTEYGYPDWVIEGVITWNRMREAGVKWEPEPIRYPRPDGPIVYPKPPEAA
jgi:hypothetical protein